MKHVIDTVANQSNTLVAGASVTVFISGTNTLALLYSDNGVTPITNPVITNANGVFDFHVADGVYDLQVSGPNIATIKQVGVEIADVTQAFGTDVNWQTENINFVNQTGVPPRPPAGSVELYSLASNKHIFLQDETGAITDLTTGGGGGGGGLPGAPTNALQKNSGSNTFVASNVIDDGTNVSTNLNARFKGPSPYTDVTAYGVRSTNTSIVPSIPGITASVTAGITTATLSSASSFQNGDGVAIYAAGAPCTLTAPSAVTVTPAVAAGPTGTGFIAATPSGGSTTYSYTVIAVDRNGGFTGALSTGTTTTGSASLGSQSVAISGFTQIGNTVTATTSTPHGISVGADVVIVSSNNGDAVFYSGRRMVSAAPDSLHFSFTTGNDVADGAPTTSISGGTVFWFNTNHISWTGHPGDYQYYIYGRNAGSLTLLGVTAVNNAANTFSTVTSWDDFGPTMMGGQLFPFWVPTTPPVASGPGMFVTTICGGAGTTTLTLCNAVTTSASNTTILFDNAPTLLAAAQTIGLDGLLYVPPGNYVVNSHLTLPGFLAIELAGSVLALNATVEVSNARIFGMLGPQIADATQFGWHAGGRIVAGHTSPGLYVNGSSGFYEGIQLASSANAQIAMLQDGAVQSHFRNINFNDGGSSSNYMTTTFIDRGSVWLDFDHVSFNTGPGQEGTGFRGTTTTPGAYFYQTGGLTFAQISVQSRGLVHVPNGVGMGVTITGQNRSQGPITPFFTLYSAPGISNAIGTISMSVEIDTSTQAKLALLGGGNSYNVNIGGSTGSDPAGGAGSVTGVPVGVVGSFGLLTGPASGQNTQAISGYNFTNNPVTVTGAGQFMFPIVNSVPPTVSLSAGGGVNVGTNCYALSMIDINGNEGTMSPFACINTTSGNQTVTIIAPPAPAGAVGWLAYRGGAGGSGATRISEDCFISGVPYRASVVDNTSFTCGIQPLRVNRAGSQSLSAAGLSGTRLNLLSNGFSGNVTSNLTASRNITVPDQSGTLAITPLAVSSISPGVSGQCINTSGTAAVWGSCAGTAGVQLICVQAQQVANSNTTAFQNIGGGCAFAAGALNALSKTIRVTLDSNFAVSAGTTLTLALNITGLGLPVGTVQVTTGSGVAGQVSASWLCSVTTTGSSGVLQCGGGGPVTWNSGTSSFAAASGTSAATSINLTSGVTFTPQVAFASGSTSNNISGAIITTEQLN